MQFIVSPPTDGSSNKQRPNEHASMLPTASTPMKSQHQVLLAKESIPALAGTTNLHHHHHIGLLSPIQDSPIHPSPVSHTHERDEDDVKHQNRKIHFEDGTSPDSELPSPTTPAPSTAIPKSSKSSKKGGVASEKKASSLSWAQTHTHLLANLNTLRNEIADWEEEAFARIKAAEDELAATKAQEQTELERQQEAEKSRQYFHNSFAELQVQQIKRGGDGTLHIPVPDGIKSPTGRRATWNAGSKPVDLSSPTGQGAPATTDSAAPAKVDRRATFVSDGMTQLVHQHRTREQDAAALKELQSVMNNEIDEKWMDTILDLTSPRKPTRSPSNGQQVPSPSRRTQSQNKPVSKVYSTLALEHRRALRRHPKIVKWLEKFWRVFERQRETEQTMFGLQGTMLSPTHAAPSNTSSPMPLPQPKSSPEPSPSPSSPSPDMSANLTSPTKATLTARELLEKEGINKHDFIKFYQLIHKALSGDDVDLTQSALHDFERMCKTRKAMHKEEFGHVLFEIIDLWCLTHIPEDYISILKALYCRITAREFQEKYGAMKTDWVRSIDIGLGPGFKVQPIITPFLEQERQASLKRLKGSQHKQKKEYQKVIKAQQDEKAEDEKDEEDEEPTEETVSSDDDDDSEVEEFQSEDEDENGAHEPRQKIQPPLTDENGQLLSLNAPEVKFAGNRLRAKEKQFVSEALLALNDTISSFHDNSSLAVRKTADDLSSPSSHSHFTLHSDQGLGYASRRKTIGLKWSIVSEVMEQEIDRAKAEREEYERRKKERERQAREALAHLESTHPSATTNASATNATASASQSSSSTDASGKMLSLPPGLDKRISLNLDGMVLGIHSHSPRRPSRIENLGKDTEKIATSNTLQLPSSSPVASSLSPSSASDSPSSAPSPNTYRRHLYSSYDEGDSDLEDEDEARIARQERKQRTGHSWPSLQRILSLRNKVLTIEASWLGLVKEAVARKKAADAVEQRRRDLKYFKRIKQVAEQQARIAGLTLKSKLEEADLPMLEQIAGISFVRGTEKTKQLIASMIEEREKQRDEELKEKARRKEELDKKRAAVLAEKERREKRRGTYNPPAEPAAKSETTPTSIVRKLDTASSNTVNPAIPNNRRVSWRDDSSSHSQLADVKSLLHPGLEGARLTQAGAAEREARANAATTAAAPLTKEEKEARDKAALSRAQKKAIVDAVVGRLTKGPVCNNPLHNHGPNSQHQPRLGVTEIGSKYPLLENEYYGEGSCTFHSPNDEVSPTSNQQPPMVISSASSHLPLPARPAETVSPQTHALVQEAHRVANEMLDSGASIPLRLARYGSHPQPSATTVQLAPLDEPTPAATHISPTATNFHPTNPLVLHGDHLQLAPKVPQQPINAVHGQVSPRLQARRRKTATTSIGTVLQRADSHPPSKVDPSSTSATSSNNGGGVPGHAHGTSSARTASPVTIPGVATSSTSTSSSLLPTMPPHAHRRQRSRSAIASPTRPIVHGGMSFNFTTLDPSLQQRPQTNQKARDDTAAGLGSQTRASLRNYLSADSADKRVHLPSSDSSDPAQSSVVHLPAVGSGNVTSTSMGGSKRSSMVPLATGTNSGSNSRSHSRQPSPAPQKPVHTFGLAASSGGGRGSRSITPSIEVGGASPILSSQPVMSPNYLPRPLPSYQQQIRPNPTNAANNRANDDSILHSSHQHYHPAMLYHQSNSSALTPPLVPMLPLSRFHSQPSQSVGNSPIIRGHSAGVGHHPPSGPPQLSLGSGVTSAAGGGGGGRSQLYQPPPPPTSTSSSKSSVAIPAFRLGVGPSSSHPSPNKSSQSQSDDPSFWDPFATNNLEK